MMGWIVALVVAVLFAWGVAFAVAHHDDTRPDGSNGGCVQERAYGC